MHFEFPVEKYANVKGVVSRIAGSVPETRYYSLLVSANDGTETVAINGVASSGLRIGDEVLAIGCLQSDCVSDRLDAQYIRLLAPSGRDAMVRYLIGVLDGVGERIVHQIVNAFGNRTYDVLRNQSDSMLDISGITQPRLALIVNSWWRHNNYMEVATLVCSAGVPFTVIDDVFARYPNCSEDQIRSSPFSLLNVPSITFEVVDRICSHASIRPARQVRSAAAVLSAFISLHKASSSTVLSREDIVRLATSISSERDDSAIRDALNWLERSERVVLRDCRSGMYSLPVFAAAEMSIAQDAIRISTGGSREEKIIAQVTAISGDLRDTAQLAALQAVFSTGISIISGAPGTGKTSVVRKIVDVCQATGLSVQLCAPTNQAAQRLSVAASYPASTLHKTLRIGCDDSWESGISSVLASEDYLTVDVLVVDEASMVDLMVGARLLKSISTGTRVVLIGDVEQISSISPGALFRDLIASNLVTTTFLKTIHRTKGNSISIVAEDVKLGRSDRLRIGQFGGFKFVDDTSPTILNVLQEFALLADLHGVENVKILGSQYASEYGIDSINSAIRELVNPSTVDCRIDGHDRSKWRVGDLVVASSSIPSAGVQNGDTGRIVQFDMDKSLYAVSIRDEERIVNLTLAEMSFLSWNYAMSINKAQGLEFDGVIVLAYGESSFSLDRNKIYTGLTRARQNAVLIGSARIVYEALGKAGNKQSTWLVTEIERSYFDHENAPYGFGHRPDLLILPSNQSQTSLTLAMQ